MVHLAFVFVSYTGRLKQDGQDPGAITNVRMILFLIYLQTPCTLIEVRVIPCITSQNKIKLYKYPNLD